MEVEIDDRIMETARGCMNHENLNHSNAVFAEYALKNYTGKILSAALEMCRAIAEFSALLAEQAANE